MIILKINIIFLNFQLRRVENVKHNKLDKLETALGFSHKSYQKHK